MDRFLSKAAVILGAAFFALALASCDAPSGDADNSEFVGKYMTEDTQGKEMTITLDDNGSASGSRADESLSGSWKEEGDSAVITWSDDWSTKITKDDDTYMKSAYKGGSQDGAPVSAKKVQ